MNKLTTTILLLFFPALALAAEGSLSFAPPAGDYSVIFLGNLFGVVDGVLHGTGSQIMGVMFGVFNSAVLALGGMIIMYTLMVSTMNTAHEGQMLGQKWSSIWIPVRSTLGMALLIPKASGYCLMQIFVMWVVVQGVGAADKIWEAALSYLNRGGVIIKAQTDPTIALTSPASAGIPGGAMNILTGQVCMIGLQNQLEKQRKIYREQMQNSKRPSGPCAIGPSDAMKKFCDTPVPDFIASVNTVTVQQGIDNSNKESKVIANAQNSGPGIGKGYSVKMPNFTTAPYDKLNGICGEITWLPIADLGSFSSVGGADPTSGVNLSEDELDTTKMSRAIAIQQMYLDLSLVAQVMVNNDPELRTTGNNTAAKPFSEIAIQQFGIPQMVDGKICNTYKDGCMQWGAAPTDDGKTGGVLFNGTEFWGAVSDYNGVMQPTLNLKKQANEAKGNASARKFIASARSQGWIMAGAYFFDLVTLNGNAADTTGLIDTGTGLDAAEATPNASKITSSFFKNSCVGPYAALCEFMDKDVNDAKAVQRLIEGNGGITAPKMELSAERKIIVDNKTSSTVYAFVNNSMMMQLPGQPGIAPLKFANLIHVNVDPTPYQLKEQEFECGRIRIVFFSFCLGEMFGNLFYNVIFLNIYNFLMAAFQQIINQAIMAFLMIPLQGMGDIFQKGVDAISQPGANPIVALANMGVMYINFSANLWLMILTMSVTSSLIPVFGVFIFALMAMAMPLLLAWIGIMVSIGFTTAYYVPTLPYMIFTFGSIAWLIAVIEAMVAAPIVALGVTHPEGHDAFGKGEAAIMILMNVFLRPAMMIIGYIAAIALSYVGVWILNAGYDHAIGFIQSGEPNPGSVGADGKHIDYAGGQNSSGGTLYDKSEDYQMNKNFNALTEKENGPGSGTGMYKEWAGVYAYFFSILTYTTMYLIIVQKAFTLISVLPDKVLRWIGGSPESMGQDSAQWGEEMKSASKEAGGKTADAQGQMSKQMGGIAQQGGGGAKSAGSKAGGGDGGVDATAGGGGAKGLAEGAAESGA